MKVYKHSSNYFFQDFKTVRIAISKIFIKCPGQNQILTLQVEFPLSKMLKARSILDCLLLCFFAGQGAGGGDPARTPSGGRERRHRVSDIGLQESGEQQKPTPLLSVCAGLLEPFPRSHWLWLLTLLCNPVLSGMPSQVSLCQQSLSIVHGLFTWLVDHGGSVVHWYLDLGSRQTVALL